MDPIPGGRKPTIAEMLNPALADSAQAGGASVKRRQSLAEMLRESNLVGNETSIAEALESRQSAAPAAPPAPSPVQTGNNRYSIYLKIDGKWVWNGDIRAASHGDGMRQIADLLKPEHDAWPIRLEQDEAAA
ncbi:MAG TPA: hypothetical protein VG269_19830 [Tepidisphaeraceae bacterium]|nr:hypothetical protein [Tepidisphaeraceae bacterium]